MATREETRKSLFSTFTKLSSKRMNWLCGMCKAVAYFLFFFLFSVKTFQLLFFLTVCFFLCNLRFDAATGRVSRYKHRGRDSIELFWWIGNPPRPHRWVDHSMLVSGERCWNIQLEKCSIHLVVNDKVKFYSQSMYNVFLVEGIR